MKIQRTPRFAEAGRPEALAVVLSGLLVMGFGCTPEIQKTSDIQTGLEVEDVPVHPGFELAKSEVYRPPIEDKGFRSSLSYYHGQGEVGEIVPYYVEKMPSFGWEFQESIYKSGDESRLLRFYKDDTVAWVRVYRGYNPVRGGYGTVVEVRIGPRGLESFDLENYFGINRKAAPGDPKSDAENGESPISNDPQAPTGEQQNPPVAPDASRIAPTSAPIEDSGQPDSYAAEMRNSR